MHAGRNREMVGVLRRSWAWVVVPTLVAAITAGVLVQVLPSRYTAEARVLLGSRGPAFAKTGSGEPVQPIDEQAVARQIQLAMSRDLARQTIRKLKLVGNAEFDPSVGEIGLLDGASVLLGLVKTPGAGTPEERVLETYYDRVRVFPVDQSRMLAFEFRSRDPELAAEGANTISELYVASQAAPVDAARPASASPGQSIDIMRARVAEAEAKLEAFRAENGRAAAGGSANQRLSAQQQLGELASQLSQARTAKADLVGRMKLLKDTIKEGRAFESPDVAINEAIRRTVERRTSLRAQLALELRTLLPQHPRIKELTAQINDLELQVKAAAERIARTLETDAQIAETRVASLQAAVDGQNAAVLKGNDSEAPLRALEREAKLQREQLDAQLSRPPETAIPDGENASPADARVVSRAVVPDTPSFPNKLPMLALATVFAFLLSAGGVIGRHLFRTSPAAPPSADEIGATRPGAGVGTLARGPHAADLERFADPDPPPAEPRYAAPVSATFETPLTASVRTPSAGLEGAASAEHGPRGTPDEPVAEATGQAAQSTVEAHAVEARDETGPDSRDDTYDFDLLIERLEAGPSHGGRCVLIVETVRHDATEPARSLAASLATVLSRRARTLKVEVNGPDGGRDDLGLSDLVAGEATFEEVIHTVAGSRLHVIQPGLVAPDVLIEEPEAVAIGLNAMAQAYAWVVCRLDATVGGTVEALLAAVAAGMDTVVIASDASATDTDLVALYRVAEQSGAGQVLVARDQRAVWDAYRSDPDMALRLSA